MRQPPSNPADAAELERLETAIRAARQRRAMFIREMSGRSRRLETQRLCVLGRAVGELAMQHPRFGDQFRTFLSGYVTRDVDRAALAGSPFDVGANDGGAEVEQVVESEHAGG